MKLQVTVSWDDPRTGELESKVALARTSASSQTRVENACAKPAVTLPLIEIQEKLVIASGRTLVRSAENRPNLGRPGRGFPIAAHVISDCKGKPVTTDPCEEMLPGQTSRLLHERAKERTALQPDETATKRTPTLDDNYDYAIPPSYFEVFDRDDQFRPIITGGRFERKPAITEFCGSGLHETVVQNVLHCKYTRPTPIQSAAIPAILSGEDLMALAQTGLGKTAAFLLPLITLIKEKEHTLTRKKLPIALILTSTHELATQIYNQALKFAERYVFTVRYVHTLLQLHPPGTGVKSVVVHGEKHAESEVVSINNGCHIVIGTMGRLRSLIDKGQLNLAHLRFMVIDEADRMLYKDYRSRTVRLLSDRSMPSVELRQTLLFSATFSNEDQLIAKKFMNPKYMMIHTKTIGVANPKIEQVILDLSAEARSLKLKMSSENEMFVLKEFWSDRDHLLAGTILMEGSIKPGDDGKFEKKILVFVEKRIDSASVAKKLVDNNITAQPINADMSQLERESSLQQFVDGTILVLVATDVAARGLHIPNVDHVINYELPSGNRRRAMEQYVNRIGRTGRAGKNGKATSFYDKSKDKDLARGLVDCMADVEQVVPEWLQREAGVLLRDIDWDIS